MRPYSISNQKIDPSRRRPAGVKPDGSPDDNDRIEIGPTQLAFDEWAAAGLTSPNLEKMREFRLQRLVEQIRKRDYGGLLCFDPLNIRYATDTTNMQLWIAHNPARACFISADGYIVLWDFPGCAHQSAHLPLVREARDGVGFFYFVSGDHTAADASQFASEIDDVLRQQAGGNRRLAVDRIEVEGVRALDALGIEIFEGQEVTELARVIKGEEEIRAMRCAEVSCHAALVEMHNGVTPGVTENDIWSVLHGENIRRGGEWIETRLLSSGPRTNPWFQECGPRVVQSGELLAFDTDLIGVYGMCIDISRTWMIGDFKPSAEHKTLYRTAYDHVMANIEIMQPGMGFQEITRQADRLPEQYRALQYGVIAHGVGLCDEYPALRYPEDYDACGYDGTLEPGMVICVEAYVGAEGGREGVKLEDQILITEDGNELLSHYPYEDRLLA